MAIEASSEQTREPRIRLGMVGGGAGAFIGAVHRIAARIDDQYDLIAGALSASPEKAIASAATSASIRRGPIPAIARWRSARRS